jgi:hypothetical protein
VKIVSKETWGDCLAFPQVLIFLVRGRVRYIAIGML